MPKKKVDKKTVRVHTCFSPEEEMPLVCACRRDIMRHQADRWVSTGMAVWISIGKRHFRDKICMLDGSSQRTPRAATIDKAHIERAYASDHGLEEQARIEAYGEMSQQVLLAMVRVVPAWKCDEDEAKDFGVPVVYDTERTK
jgi:hypothetical protein